MRTKNEIKNICEEMVSDFITNNKNTNVLVLTYEEYLEYDNLVNKILRKYTPTLNVSEDKSKKIIGFSINERCPYNIVGCLKNALHKSNKHFDRISLKKFKFTKLAFLNNLKKRKERLLKIDNLRKANKIEKVKHSDEIARIKKALEV